MANQEAEIGVLPNTKTKIGYKKAAEQSTPIAAVFLFPVTEAAIPLATANFASAARR